MSKFPVARQVAWISLIPHLSVFSLIFLAVFLIGSELEIDNVFIISALCYIALSLGVRSYFAREHRKGMALVKKNSYREAIQYFEKSYGFFTERAWMDRYRYLVLLTSTAISYREMALINIAFCYGQLGEAETCKAFYSRALQEFPDSIMAQHALTMANTFEDRSSAAST